MFRIKEYPKGFVIETQRTTWYGFKYWTHYISVYGIDSEPWYYSSYERAERNLLDAIKRTTKQNSQ